MLRRRTLRSKHIQSFGDALEDDVAGPEDPIAVKQEGLARGKRSLLQIPAVRIESRTHIKLVEELIQGRCVASEVFRHGHGGRQISLGGRSRD